LNRHRGARYLAVEYLKAQARNKEQYRDLLRAQPSGAPDALPVV
jgi:hypothetical protein